MKPAPSLFDAAAEARAFASGRPLSQERTELEHGNEAPPIGGLFDTDRISEHE